MTFLLTYSAGAQILTSRKYSKILRDYEMVWSDEFDSTGIDRSSWSYRAVGPRGNGVVNRSAASVKDGKLVIRAYDSAGTVYTSQLCTDGKRDFTYGYFEARMKLNEDQGASSSFWVQTRDMGKHIGRPDSAGVELDVMEFRPVKPDRVNHTIHWDGYGEHHKRDGSHSKLKSPHNYHTFSMLWDEKGYTFFVDGKKTKHIKKPVSKTKQYIIFSLEVIDWAGKINPDLLPDEMLVDYVRVYQKK